LLTESLLLSISGGLLGTFLATAGIRYLNAANPAELPPGNPITINWQILAFTAVLAIFSAALFGLAPAWKASHYDLNAVLKKEGGRSHRAAKYFVVSEVALSLALLAGAALMIQSLVRLTSTPLGFEPAHLLTANVDLASKTYSAAEQRLNFYNNLKRGVLAIPGVQGVAFAPLNVSGSNALSVEGSSGAHQGALGNDVSTTAVDADYFRVMEIPLFQGREFNTSDGQKALPVAIINEALATKYLHGDPIGQHIKLGNPEDKNPWLTVVGVVGNVKGFVVFKEMGYVTDPCVYLPLTQSPDSRVAILVRSAQDPTVLTSAIRDEFSHLDGSLPPLDLTTMHAWLSEFLTQPRFRAALLSIFASLGLVLCSIGIFGVVSVGRSAPTRNRRTHGAGRTRTRHASSGVARGNGTCRSRHRHRGGNRISANTGAVELALRCHCRRSTHPCGRRDYPDGRGAGRLLPPRATRHARRSYGRPEVRVKEGRRMRPSIGCSMNSWRARLSRRFSGFLLDVVVRVCSRPI